MSLISVASKLLADIILCRLFSVCERYMHENQAGFGVGRGRTAQIFIQRQILEHKRMIRRPMIYVFLDLKEAFELDDRAVSRGFLPFKDVPEKFNSLI